MEAALFDLILDVAASLLANIPQYLAQHPLQRVALYGTALRAFGRGDGRIAILADVEGCAEEVTALCGGITVTALKAGHILLCPQDTRHDDAVQGNTFYI